MIIIVIMHVKMKMVLLIQELKRLGFPTVLNSYRKIGIKKVNTTLKYVILFPEETLSDRSLRHYQTTHYRVLQLTDMSDDISFYQFAIKLASLYRAHLKYRQDIDYLKFNTFIKNLLDRHKILEDSEPLKIP